MLEGTFIFGKGLRVGPSRAASQPTREPPRSPNWHLAKLNQIKISLERLEPTSRPIVGARFPLFHWKERESRYERPKSDNCRSCNQRTNCIRGTECCGGLFPLNELSTEHFGYMGDSFVLLQLTI